MALEKKLTENGTKARQREDTEDRSLPYRDWRRTAGSTKVGARRSTCYTTDVDQVEFVIVKNEVHPVAVIDITRFDDDEYTKKPESWAKYRQAVLDRYFFRDSQGQFMRCVANKMGVPAYLVLFRKDVKSFWVFEMTKNDADWIHMSDEEYYEFLKKLKTDALARIAV